MGACTLFCVQLPLGKGQAQATSGVDGLQCVQILPLLFPCSPSWDTPPAVSFLGWGLPGGDGRGPGTSTRLPPSPHSSQASSACALCPPHAELSSPCTHREGAAVTQVGVKLCGSASAELSQHGEHTHLQPPDKQQHRQPLTPDDRSLQPPRHSSRANEPHKWVWKAPKGPKTLFPLQVFLRGSRPLGSIPSTQTRGHTSGTHGSGTE